jgi:acyl-CoA reductase-like NAD-dependent aldehyde dehydrogenase
MATNEYHSTTGANGSSDTTNGPKVTVPLWINGKEESGSSTFDVMSPYTGEVCWKAAAASKQDTIRATEVAQRAFLSWSKTKLSTRRDLLMKAADIMDSRVEEYREIMQTEMGADEGMSGFLVPSSIAMLRELADWTMTICGRSPVCQDDGRSAIVFKEPYGVILGIVPW